MDKYLQDAINEYEQKIESGEPFYMEASTLMDIEETYEKAGRAYDAERLMRFAEKLHPDSEDVLIVKAYREKDRGHWHEAMRIIQGIANQESRNVQLFYAEKEVASGLLEEAEKRVNDSLPAVMSEESYDWYLDLGEIFLDYGFQKKALKYLTQIPKNYQFAERVYELMADAYFQLQDYDKSIETANTLVDLNPYNATSWAQLADIQQKRKMYEECVQSCDYALAINPKNVKGMSLKVFALLALQRSEEALHACHEYIKIVPNEYSMRMYAGEHLCSLGRFKESLSMFRDALRLCPIDCPDRTRIITDITYSYVTIGQYDKAEDMLMSTCLLGNSVNEILFQLGTAYIEVGQLERGLNTYRRVLHLPNVEEKDISAIAQNLVQTNQIESAKDFWHEMAFMISSSENSSIVNAYVAWVMFQLNERELMLQNLKKAFPNFVGVIIQLFGSSLGTYNIDEILYKIEQGYQKE